MPSQSDELEASIAELEAFIASADPESRAMLEQQLSTMRQLRGMLRAAETAATPGAAELSPEMRAFFAPDPPAEVPAWVPDTLERAQVTEETMRCPAGARVYYDEGSVGCGIPQTSGPPFRHGLELGFHRSTGRLRYQRFYENRLLRWAVEYHVTGGRELVGLYVATERLEYPEDGLHTRFAPNGTVVSQTWYRAGVRHGWSKMWNDDGTPIGAVRFEGGVEVEQVLPDGGRRFPAR